MRKGVLDERKYSTNKHDFNNIITYNEKILLKETNYQKINYKEKLSIRKNYAFILFLESIFQNFLQNKENILNRTQFPILFFNNKFEYVYKYENGSYNFGESETLIESFICDISILKDMEKLEYELGEYLQTKYFIDKDFSLLIKNFLDKKQQIINSYKNEINGNEKLNNKIRGESKDDEGKILSKNEEKQETVIFSRYNVVIITAETLEELFVKVEEMKNKKFIRPKNALPRNDDKTCY